MKLTEQDEPERNTNRIRLKEDGKKGNIPADAGQEQMYEHGQSG